MGRKEKTDEKKEGTDGRQKSGGRKRRAGEKVLKKRDRYLTMMLTLPSQ